MCVSKPSTDAEKIGDNPGSLLGRVKHCLVIAVAGYRCKPVYVSGGADTREPHHRDAADNIAHPCSHKRGE